MFKIHYRRPVAPGKILGHNDRNVERSHCRHFACFSCGDPLTGTRREVLRQRCKWLRLVLTPAPGQSLGSPETGRTFDPDFPLIAATGTDNGDPPVARFPTERMFDQRNNLRPVTLITGVLHFAARPDLFLNLAFRFVNLASDSIFRAYQGLLDINHPFHDKIIVVTRRAFVGNCA